MQVQLVWHIDLDELLDVDWEAYRKETGDFTVRSEVHRTIVLYRVVDLPFLPAVGMFLSASGERDNYLEVEVGEHRDWNIDTQSLTVFVRGEMACETDAERWAMAKIAIEDGWRERDDRSA